MAQGFVISRGSCLNQVDLGPGHVIQFKWEVM